MLCVNGITFNMGLAHSPSIISDGLVFYLDAANTRSYSGSGTTWIDIIGTGNTCTLVNGPSFVGSGGTSAFSFDGTNDYASSSNIIFPDTGPFTVEIFYRITGTGGRGGIFERVESGVYNGMNFGQNAPAGVGGWDFTVASDINTGLTLAFAFPTTNLWYSDTGVYNGSNQITIYRNGNYVDSFIGTTQGNLSTNGTRSFKIANRLDRYLPCQFNNIRIYNRALTQQEILQNYNATRKRFGL